MNDQLRGIILDIHRSSLQDGPGLRTTVFFKGCPLRCAWCHNPESWTLQPAPVVKPSGAGGKTVYGYEISVREIMDLVRRDRTYYELSNGGVTLSGGEPTMQHAFCQALLEAARAEGIHTCLDTCGHVETERLLALHPLVDLYHYDYKVTGAAAHQQWTGVSDELILRNLDVLMQQHAAIILRCPLIPGVNDRAEHFDKLGELARRYPSLKIELLPYHAVGQYKFEQVGLPPPQHNPPPPTEATQQSWRAQLVRAGVKEGQMVGSA